MEIYIARHGETEWNALRQLCGHTDVDLTTQGVEQAYGLARQLKDKGIELIFCSPLRRARRTAAPASEVLDAPVVVDARLIEQNFGEMEGAPYDSEEVRAARRNFALRFGGGESLLDLSRRLYAFLDELRAGHADKNVLLVSHGTACRIMHSYFHSLTNEEYFGLQTGNCQWRHYTIDG